MQRLKCLNFRYRISQSHNTLWMKNEKSHIYVEGLEDWAEVIPFGVEQISNLLVVDLHVGHLDGEALLLLLFLLGSFEQSAAEARDQARLVHRAHHGVRLSRAWKHTRRQRFSFKEADSGSYDPMTIMSRLCGSVFAIKGKLWPTHVKLRKIKISEVCECKSPVCP